MLQRGEGAEAAKEMIGVEARRIDRPLLDDGDPQALFKDQLAVREQLVLPIADLVIDVTTMPKDDQAAAVVALVR